MIYRARTGIPLLLFFMLSILYPVLCAAQGIPQKGERLPAFILNTPTSEQDQQYLGIGSNSTFTFEDLKAKLVMIETVGVYCPQCHIQLPKINNMYRIISKDPSLNQQVKIIAIAVGANSTEVDHLKQQLKIAYPVIIDPQFDIHKKIGEPRTPFNMIVRYDQEILFTHLGPLTDTDTLLNQIRLLVKQSE